MVASSMDGNTRRLTYHCSECDEEFDRAAKL